MRFGQNIVRLLLFQICRFYLGIGPEASELTIRKLEEVKTLDRRKPKEA